MNFWIKVCQGCRKPLQLPLETVTDVPFDFCVAGKEWHTYKDLQTGQLCTLSSSGCMHSSRWAVICVVFTGHPWLIASTWSATKTSLQNSSVWGPVRFNACHFRFLCLVWPIYIAVEVQFISASYLLLFWEFKMAELLVHYANTKQTE